MIAQLTALTLKLGDLLFGWLLALPGDLPLAALAGLTTLWMVAVRRSTTDQDLLRRCRADRRVLAAAMRRDRAAGDGEALARHRSTWQGISRMRLAAEFRPLLVSLLPLALLATWCCARLAFLPPAPGQEVSLSLRRPLSASGRLVHLVPQEGLQADGWIRGFAPDPSDPRTCVATWRLTAPSAADYDLVFRFDGGQHLHHLAIGRRTYAAPEQAMPETGIVSAVALAPRRLLGRLPGVPALGLQPWMAAYLLLTVPLFMIVRRLLRIE